MIRLEETIDTPMYTVGVEVKNEVEIGGITEKIGTMREVTKVMEVNVTKVMDMKIENTVEKDRMAK